MSYVLGHKSRAALYGVHPSLVKTVERAIQLTAQDFIVFEGLRSQSRQDEYLKRGVTRVKHSQHMKQTDGFGHAVDLVPWVDGGPRWEWPLIYPIAAAMREAADMEGVRIRWGGVWDKPLRALGEGAFSIKNDVAKYCNRHPGPDFIDGPHFELTSL